MIVLEILILIFLWLISCVLCAAVGFFIAIKVKRPTARAEPHKLTEEQQRQVLKAKLERDNFLNYTGSPQEPIDAQLR